MIIEIDSLSQLHKMAGLPAPQHPLISVVDVSEWEISEDLLAQKFCLQLYSIALKDGGCGMNYGRNSYDFSEGVLLFTAAGQISSMQESQKKGERRGWMIFFHPDLIRNKQLGQKIDEYHFFSYEVHEALHLSAAEQTILNRCADLIQEELAGRIDDHTQDVIVDHLQLLLTYSQRYYQRQFNTRSAQNSDLLSRFEQLLKTYYQEGRFAEEGQPAVGYFAAELQLSANYLSDLIKKETGYGVKEKVQQFVVEKAKLLLLQSAFSISELAYQLGYNYPHYFSRMFKAKTGLTPKEYRKRA
ncbi:helix-turn-helix domain-containing protein [Saprospira grandis]|uniref:AraC family transcriptional regulator n=1 Tax=Saprospira grandis (strain Lewin) TaxID=984262 RepID=H6L781_SAPGL|nr:helix-turn-helix domain-containing protein [Saprospira grandis]AFC26672.1 putative AraC family transcriptional regulator [Saprospira grandis str. Lewin]